MSVTDWVQELDGFLQNDHLAILKVERLVTNFLVKFGAYDFRDEWSDLRQQVLEALLRAGAGRLRNPGAFVDYVGRITHNKFSDRLRKSLNWNEKGILPWDEESARMMSRTDERGTERAIDIQEALRRLRPDQERVLRDKHWGGKTLEEVACEMGVSLSTVKRLLR